MIVPGSVSWTGPATKPLFGPDAEADLQTIADDNFRRAKRLLKMIDRLLYASRPSIDAMRIPDPLGVGPRYFVELRDGYGAIYWVLEPPGHMSGAGPAIWIERVIATAHLAQAFAEQASDS